VPSQSTTAAASRLASLRDFLRRRQLGYASYLLQAAPTLSIRAVAVASGFGTPSTFHRCFKAAYGSSPAAYREVMKCDTSKEILPARGVTPIRIGKVMKCE
jgi:AraC-like DNA-binding protein